MYVELLTKACPKPSRRDGNPSYAASHKTLATGLQTPSSPEGMLSVLSWQPGAAYEWKADSGM
jgi:hypothetical protein